MKKTFSLPKLFTKKIGVRLFGYMAFNVIFVILICCIFNIFALNKFYTHEKTNELISTLYQIENIYSQDISTESRNLVLEKISNDKNIHIVITNRNDEVAYSSLPKDAIRFEMHNFVPNPHPDLFSHISGNTLLPNIHNEVIERFNFPAPSSSNDNYFARIPKELHNLLGLDKNEDYDSRKQADNTDEYRSKIIEKTDKYEIRNNFNSRLNSFEIALVSTLDNGYDARLSLAMSPINESAGYLNRFLLIVGGISILLSLIPMMLLIRSFTRPIRELSDIAKNMANLKFDKKYRGHQKNEIGELGMSINTMSEKLETTICELKNDIIEKESIDKRRREFLSNVSHELKTPIALVEAYAEGLNENIAMSDEDKAYYCEVILDEANKMSNIIQKLMSLMRIESGEDTVEFSDYNITEQISRVISEQSVLFADDENLKIEFEPSENIFVTADEFLIDEVLTNYLTNAVKYRTQKSLINIYISNLDANKIQVNVYNATDEPFTEEELLKIWDRFYMADKARTYVDGSRGLGLSIVSAIMKAHNQEYGVENTNDGVIFYFTLQKAETEQDTN